MATSFGAINHCPSPSKRPWIIFLRGGGGGGGGRGRAAPTVQLQVKHFED